MICCGVKSQLESHLARLKRLQAHAGVDVLLQNGIGILRGHLLDLHSARRRGHEYRLAFRAVDQNPQVQFFFDGQSFFDQQPPHDAAFGAGLMRD